MLYSETAQQITESFEGLRLSAYRDSVGVWTIGYGHTQGVYPGQTCTQAQAVAWLLIDLAQAEAFVNGLGLTLTQGEFDALVDFAFNLGIAAEQHSTLLALVKAGDWAGAAGQFPRWDYAGGVQSAGLLRRRLVEQGWFEGSAA